MEEKQKQKLKQIDQEQNNTSQSIHQGQHSINETAMTLNLKQDNQLKTDQTQHFIQQHYNNINNSNSVNNNQNGEQSSFLNITNSLQQIQSPNQSFNVNNNNTSFTNKKKKSQKGSKQQLSQSHINSNYISILNGIGSEHNMESLRSSRKIQMLQKRGSQKSIQNLQKIPAARLSIENQNEGLELSNRSGLSRNAQSVKTQRNNKIKYNLSTVNPNKLPNIINFYEDEIMKIEEYNYMLQKNKEIEQQFYQQKKTIKSIKSQTNLVKKSKYSDFKYQDAITGQSFVRQGSLNTSFATKLPSLFNNSQNKRNNILSTDSILEDSLHKSTTSKNLINSLKIRLQKQKSAFEQQTNPLSLKKISKTKKIIADFKKSFYKYDLFGNLKHNIKEDYIFQTIDGIDFLFECLQKLKTNIPVQEVNEQLGQIIEQSRLSGLLLIFQQNCLIKAKFNMMIGNYYQALRTLFMVKTFARQNKYFDIKLKCYKQIGKCFLELRQYKFALNAYLKMLILAWYQKDRYLEIFAYDQLGLIYFYQGNLKFSKILHQKSLIGRAEPYESTIRNKKINQYNNILSQTEDERNQRKLKQQNKIQQNSEAKLLDDENDKYINDSSEDENDNFIQEIIVQEIVQKSEDESIFKLEREKQMRFSQNKKKNEKDQDQGILQLVDFGGNKVKHIKRLAHQSNNRQTTNFKLLTGKDLLSYKNKEEEILNFQINKKSLDYLFQCLSKQRKRIYILTNYLNQFQALEKQKKEQQLYDEQKKNTQQHQYNNSNIDILNESKVPKYQKRQGLKKFF